LNALSSGNTGLTFIWLPALFEKTFGGAFFMGIFFLALTFAALAALISMMELAVRILIDFGFQRNKSIVIIAFLAFILGIPSSVSIGFLENQDWTWGLGLLISGFFIAFVAIKYNTKRFRDTLINTEGNDMYLGKWFDIVVKYVIPVEFIALIGWWFYQSITIFDKSGWWNPFHIYSVGTCIFQWGIVVLILLLFNQKIAQRTLTR
jgi:NSS family neurotransmitter:Na+ symporter